MEDELEQVAEPEFVYDPDSPTSPVLVLHSSRGHDDDKSVQVILQRSADVPKSAAKSTASSATKSKAEAPTCKMNLQQ